MTERPVKNMAASIHQRLLNFAKERSRPFNEVLQYYAMERFLYRLAHSRHGEKFVLKGALMLGVWKAPVSRPTMDIDLLGHLDNSIETLTAVARDVCVEKGEPDGLTFDPDAVKANGSPKMPIMPASGYDCWECWATGHQIDKGF